ncbi:LOW QUALITY PROTEIN: small ribosomal subunit protein uS5c [Cicer arietinum]|uniref:Small ribosomal subunit protein uS5c n=1 Tax=Cicer arietinum TaxID=3827 RepID=A0A1S2YIH5_CICAR|nr:LOW QUALITY PROTEIN: 30S ribosomal protein S5, chloroplastic [Cicer arietinum]
MASAHSSALNSLSSFSLRPSSSSSSSSRFSLLSNTNKLTSLSSPKLHSLSTSKSKSSDETDNSFFDTSVPEEDLTFNPPEIPEGFVAPPSIEDGPVESEDEIAAAYEELYGTGYSGVSVLGNDIYAMDSKAKKMSGFGSGLKKEKIRDGFEERVVQVRRVTKVVKGGKQMRFRAIVVVGDKKGQVGVGVGKAKEVIAAVQKAAINARRNLVRVPMTKYLTFPHRSDGDVGAAKVMLRPASPGTGVIAGGSVRIVLEMAGVENALGKQLGSDNALNNARATVVAVQRMRQYSEVSAERGIPMEELWK